MAVVVLDSGVVGAFAGADRLLRERVARLVRRSGEPFLVPATVIIEATTGSPARDARVNRFLRGCEIVVLGTDLDDLRALAAHAAGVEVFGLSDTTASVE